MSSCRIGEGVNGCVEGPNDDADERKVAFPGLVAGSDNLRGYSDGVFEILGGPRCRPGWRGKSGEGFDVTTHGVWRG